MSAAAPPRPKSSGRTVLIAVGFVAGLALAAWVALQMGRVYTRFDIAKQLQRYGARVHWECHLLRNGELLYITDVNIDRPTFPDEGLELLRHLTALKCVKLLHARFNDTSLEYIAAVPDLKYVVLQDTSVTPEGVARLKGKRPELTIMMPTRNPPPPPPAPQ